MYPADLLSKEVPFLCGHISDHNCTFNLEQLQVAVAILQVQNSWANICNYVTDNFLTRLLESPGLNITQRGNETLQTQSNLKHSSHICGLSLAWVTAGKDLRKALWCVYDYCTVLSFIFS